MLNEQKSKRKQIRFYMHFAKYFNKWETFRFKTSRTGQEQITIQTNLMIFNEMFFPKCNKITSQKILISLKQLKYAFFENISD